MKFTAILTGLAVTATFVAAGGRDQASVDEEVIIVGKKPPAGAVIYAPTGQVRPHSDESPKTPDNKPSKQPPKDAKESKEPSTTDSQEEKTPVKGNKKDTPTPTGKEDLGLPTRLFRPRYRNSAQTTKVSLQTVALVSLSVIFGILLL